jgi:hypothetical protein
MARSTVGAILGRLGLGRLSNLDPKPSIQRYEYEAPSGMIHIDMEKLGRTDDIGPHIAGDSTGKSKTPCVRWQVLHVAIDDASRSVVFMSLLVAWARRRLLPQLAFLVGTEQEGDVAC